MASPAACPVASALRAVSLDGVPTTLVLSVYADALYLVVTQTGKGGTILQARMDDADTGGVRGEPTFDVRVLLGERDRPFLTVVARRLVSVCADPSCPLARPTLLCSLALKARGAPQEPSLSPSALSTLASEFKEMLYGGAA